MAASYGLLKKLQSVDQFYLAILQSLTGDHSVFDSVSGSNLFTSDKQYFAQNMQLKVDVLDGTYSSFTPGGNEYGASGSMYVPNLDKLVADSYDSPPEFLNKSFFSEANQVDQSGSVIVDFSATGGNPVFKATEVFDGSYDFHDWNYMGKYFYPRFHKMAQGNPRFNRWMNPIYFTGLSGVPVGPFLDEFLDPNRPNNDSFWSDKIKSVLVSDSDKVLNAQQYNSIVAPFLIPASNQLDPGQYDQLIVHVGDSNYDTYWDSIMPSVKNRIANLLNVADDFSQTAIGDAGNNILGDLKFVTGIDVLKQKDLLLRPLEQKFGTSSDDPFFSSKNGLILGQELGPFFKTSLQGFYNSTDSAIDKQGDPGYSLAREARKILSALGSKVGDSLGRETSHKFEDRISWYLPNTNPATNTLDERLKYGWRMQPTKRDITALADAFFQKDINSTTFLQGLTNQGKQIVSDVSDTISNILGLSDGAVAQQDKTLDGQPVQLASFLDRYLPADATKNDTGLWDRTIDLILQGDVNKGTFAPLIPLEFHRNYVANPATQANRASWFVVDKDRAIERNANNFITNFAIDAISRPDYPNIKLDNDDAIRQFKDINQGRTNIFEGVQQVDGSYERVKYNTFDPQNGQADLNSSEYLANVKSDLIKSLLNEPNGTLKSPRIYNQLTPNDMANTEPQYFPFYIRTLNRQDGAIVQQLFEDSGGVFMGKRRKTGSSIVFLEPVIENIAESYQSGISRDQYLGRVEQILNYTGTQRTFGISFSIPVAKPQDMPTCRAKVTEIIRMMYPQVMAIKEVGVIGFRRGPLVEIRIGDMYLIKGMIESVSLAWGGESKMWELIPGGRMLRGCKIDLQLAVTHSETPGAHFDPYSPTFRPEVFIPGNKVQDQNDRTSQLFDNSALSTATKFGSF